MVDGTDVVPGRAPVGPAGAPSTHRAPALGPGLGGVADVRSNQMVCSRGARIPCTRFAWRTACGDAFFVAFARSVDVRTFIFLSFFVAMGHPLSRFRLGTVAVV